MSLQTNAVEVHEISVAGTVSKSKKGKGKNEADGQAKASGTDRVLQAPQKVFRLDLPGHRTDAKCLSFSSDATMLASVAVGSVKVWSTETRKCLRSIDDLDSMPSATASMRSGLTCMCLAWLSGDSHLAVGCKEGNLLLIDLASGAIVTNDADAHEDCIWSMDLSPDGRILVTGSADKHVKFWSLEEKTVAVSANASPAGGSDESDDEEEDKEEEEEEESGGEQGVIAAVAPPNVMQKTTQLVHTRTLKMGDDVMSVRFTKTRSVSKLLVAVATLDFTVRVFFANSLRFFLQLYGHSLPVHCMDASDDSTLMATAGADKTLKFWGLDFGDCHRSLLAHQDAITAVAFVPRTHYILTASKDKTIKYWDADHFEQILTLQVSTASCT